MTVSRLFYLLVISVCIFHCLVRMVSSRNYCANWQAISRRLHVSTNGLNLLIPLEGPCQCQGCFAF